MNPPQKDEPLTFDPAGYGSACRQLLESAPLMPLGPGREQTEFEAALDQLSPRQIVGGEPGDANMARCCLAGLWLRYGFLDRSHTISQDIATAEGSYWHGIMHRHEPDYGNAKYWFRQVGEHALFYRLGPEAARRAARFDSPDARRLAASEVWDPYQFIDLCQENEDGGADYELCLELVELEWQALFDYCHRAAAA